MVEYARTFLMSFWATAMVAAKSAVIAPTMAITVGAYDDAALRTGLMRHIRNTPAVTMVAAWISADTGVGPSIASGSQMYSGSCADFAMAPARSRKPISSRVELSVLGSAAKTPA